MNEQQIRDEIEAARLLKFPGAQAGQLKILLEDVYYKSINEEKLAAVTCPDNVKEAHIQNIISATTYLETLETQLVALEPSWVRPPGALLDLFSHGCVPNTHSQVLSGGIAHIYETLTVSGTPVDIKGAQACWPLGSIFISASPTNPALSMGFGIWTSFGSGRCLFGFDATQTEFDTAEEIGGNKVKTLTINEVPPHNHNIMDGGHTHVQDPHTHAQNAHAHTLPVGATDDTSAPFDRADAGSNTSGANASTSVGSTTATNQSATAVNQSATTGITIQNTGGGQSFSLLNPYIVVFMWKRVG